MTVKPAGTEPLERWFAGHAAVEGVVRAAGVDGAAVLCWWGQCSVGYTASPPPRESAAYQERSAHASSPVLCTSPLTHKTHGYVNTQTLSLHTAICPGRYSHFRPIFHKTDIVYVAVIKLHNIKYGEYDAWLSKTMRVGAHNYLSYYALRLQFHEDPMISWIRHLTDTHRL